MQTVGMAFIPAGPFAMGTEEGGEFESPVHEVDLNGFWMDETPVTNHQFERFVHQTGYQTDAECSGSAWGYRDGGYRLIAGLSWRVYGAAGRENHPVVLVSWFDATAYCTWAGKRLPTEAEWEKAAQGGSSRRLYPWGAESPDGTQSNFAKEPAAIPPTTAVGQFPPNEYGLYDMVGNVWQWCLDCYGEGYYSTGPRTNPIGPESGPTRVRRGGSWNVIQPFRLRCSNRGAAMPSACAPNIGFRCARS
jgi:formylglycine-generating enzyme